MSSCDLVPNLKTPDQGKPLTGWKVLAILLGFFGVIFSVNAYMAYSAISTFSGEVEPHPYEHGVAYNSDIAHAREQAARGWKVDVSLERAGPGETRILVTAHDAKGAEVSAIALAATLASPVDKKQDRSVKLQETAPGRYEARVAAPPGVRDLVLTAEQGGREIFRSQSRLKID